MKITSGGFGFPRTSSKSTDVSYRSSKSRFIPLIASIAAVIFVAACEGPQEREAAYMEKARALYKDGRFVKAGLEFRNALQINPTNLEARYSLGLIFERQRKFKQAFRIFHAVVIEKPQHPGANLHLAQFYLLAGDVGEAQKRLKVTLEKEPANAQGRALQAAIYLRRGQTDKAIAEAQAARKIDQDSLAAMAVLVRAYRQSKQAEKALAVLDETIKRQPKATVPLLLRISLNLQGGKRDLVKGDFARLFKIAPKEPAFRLAEARVHMIWKETAAAELSLREAVKLAPKNDNLKKLIVVFLQRSRKYQAAEQSLKQLLAEHPANTIFRFGLADFYARKEQAAKAEAIYRAIIEEGKDKPDAIVARVALARLHLIKHDDVAARRQIETALKADPANEAGMLLLGQIEFKEKKFDEVVTLMRRLLHSKPGSVAAMRLISETYIRKKEFDLASDTLAKLVALKPRDNRFQVRLAQVYTEQKRYAAAHGIVDKVLAKSPDYKPALVTKARILTREARYGAASTTLNRLLKITSNKPFVYRMLGEVHLRNRNYAEAVVALEKAAESGRVDNSLALGITRAHIALKEFAKAENRVRAFIQKAPKQAFLHNLLGEVYRYQNKPDRAHGAFEAAMKLNPQWAVPYLNRSNIYLANNDSAAALKVIESGLMKVRKKQALLFAAGIIYERLGNIDNAIKSYKTILATNQSVPAVANNLAMLLVTHKGDDTKSLDQALTLARSFSAGNNPSFLDTLGWVHYKRGEFKDAIRHLRRSVTLAGNAPEFRYHLGMAYYRDGQAKLAHAELSKAVKGGAKFRGTDEAKTILAGLEIEASKE